MGSFLDCLYRDTSLGPPHVSHVRFWFYWSYIISHYPIRHPYFLCWPIRWICFALSLFLLSSHWESDELIFSQTRVRVKRCYTLWVFSVCLLRDNPSSQTKKQSWCDIVSISLYLPAVFAVSSVHILIHHRSYDSYWQQFIIKLPPAVCTMFVWRLFLTSHHQSVNSQFNIQQVWEMAALNNSR